MATDDVAKELAKLEGPSTPPANREAGYKNLLLTITLSNNANKVQHDLAAFVTSVVGDSVGIVAARSLLEQYVDALGKLKDTTIRVESGQHALRCLEPRVASFEEHDAKIREILADSFQESEDYLGAAKALQGIQLESSQRKVSDETKVKTWIRICRLYLEEDDTTGAESYLNRAKALQHKVHDPELTLIFQLSQARILDSHRKFLEASQAYHSVSLAATLAEDERHATLSKAIICAVLAPAGPDRSRALGKLYKDERATNLDEFSILEKMFLDRTISPSETAAFSESLTPHQLATTSDGSTVLAKAVIEHNVLGASKLYRNLGVAELGTLLNLNADRAEEYVGHMLEQGRLAGKIDQIQGVIFFGESTMPGTAANLGASLSTTGQWDRHVRGIVEDVERVSSLLQVHLSPQA